MNLLSNLFPELHFVFGNENMFRARCCCAIIFCFVEYV